MIENLAKLILGKKTKKDANSTYKVSEEDFAPYVCHFDKNTILTKNGELLQIIRVTGLENHESALEISSLRESVRKSIAENIKETKFALWFSTVRRKKNINPAGEYEDLFSQKLSESWVKKNNLQDQYVNELYITIIIEGVDTSVGNFSGFTRSLSYGATTSLHSKALQNHHESLIKATNAILADIEGYGAKILGMIEWKGVLYSEPMRFFGKIMNLHEERYPVAMNDISSDLTSHTVAFGDRELEVVGRGNKNYATIFSLKEYKEITTASLDHILQLPFEFIITQSFDFLVQEKELASYKYHNYILSVSGDEDLRDISGLSSMVEEQNMEGLETKYGKLQTTLMIIANNKEDLTKDISEFLEHIHDLGLVVVREDIFLEHCFWGQLPANFTFLRRQKVASTNMVGGFAALHDYPSGAMSGNHWGPAITILNTVIDTPYYINFHDGKCGHSLFAGPVNSGKTVLLNFLISQSQKFKPKVIFIDSTGKSECFINALGGKYAIFSSQNHENNLTLNPFSQTPKDPKFIAEFLLSLVEFHKEKITAEEQVLIQNIAQDISKSEVKNLQEAVEFFNKKESVNIHNKLSLWLTNKVLKDIFSDEENLDLSQQVTGINLAKIYEHKTILVPILSYLLNKITKTLDGNPAILVLEDAWQIFDNKILGQKVDSFLKLMAEKNCVVLLTCSDEQKVANSKISKNILSNIASQFYMPNPNISKSYEAFGLNADEIKVIKDMSNAENKFLFKHSDDAIIFDFSLKDSVEFLDILSNSELTLETMKNILSQTNVEEGQKISPNMWLEKFMNELKDIEKKRIEDIKTEIKLEKAKQRKRLREKFGSGIDD